MMEPERVNSLSFARSFQESSSYFSLISTYLLISCYLRAGSVSSCNENSSMQRGTLEHIDGLCHKLIKAKGSSKVMEKIVRDGIRQRTLQKDSLPLVVQRCALHHSDWCLALEVLQCKELQRHGLQRDDNLWRIVDRALPPDPEAKSAAHRILASVFKGDSKR
eukprot:gene4444-3243_t